MFRVSTNMPNDDMQYRLRRQEEGLNSIQSKIGTQKRINELRDDPLAAAHTVRYESYISRLERFEKNTLYAQDHYRQLDIYLQRSVEVMQRIRELAVAGSNGTFAKEDVRNEYRAVTFILENGLVRVTKYEEPSEESKKGPDGYITS